MKAICQFSNRRYVARIDFVQQRGVREIAAQIIQEQLAVAAVLGSGDTGVVGGEAALMRRKVGG